MMTMMTTTTQHSLMSS